MPKSRGSTPGRAKPPKGTGRRKTYHPRGPRRWLEEGLLSLYDEAPGCGGRNTTESPSAQPTSRLPVAEGATAWRGAFDEYKHRKEAVASAVPLPGASSPAVGAPAIPGSTNWLPLGPTVVMDGQTGGEERQPVAGRIAGIAVGPGGNTVYAASANGGVFRSTDGALTWESMDSIDLDPNSSATASLICGAIVMDPANANRVFVGTGEGATFTYFARRITGALPAYRGVGILRTENGGSTWMLEPSAPDLSGQAFFALALNPADRESLLAATTAGLYRRSAKPGGQFEWVRVANEVFSSVAAASAAGVTRFFSARWRQETDAQPADVLCSEDGSTWRSAGSGFPRDVGRITLSVQPENPDVVYALVAAFDSNLDGLYRLDGVGSPWKKISGVPNLLPSAQGNYDLAIAVDPERANIVYLGGSHDGNGASIWRCDVQPSGAGHRVAAHASIGRHAHSDVHALVHTPNNPNELWCGCDGGVFLNRDPRGTGKFTAQNNGLACLCCNFIAQHPTDPSIIITGLQDNGTALKTGSFWRHVQDGDGGYCVINWADPSQVLVFGNGRVFRSTNGGRTHESWSQLNFWGWRTMTQPIVGLPFDSDPANVADAQLVATGVGRELRISEDFGATWPSTPALRLPTRAGEIFAIAFASRTRLFIGTTVGLVFRADRSQGTWTAKRCEGNNGRLGVTGVITDIAVDWADPSRNSIYVAFGSITTLAPPGQGGLARLWWFDGNDWHARNGTAPNNLLNVEHNALAIDRQSPNNVFVGADIGVWHSADGGRNWELFQNGLPDAPVFDLQIHPTQRLLRAATHGRGVYEIPT